MASWGRASASFASFALQDCWGLRRGQPHEVLDARTGLLCLMSDQAGSGDHSLGRRNTAITLGEAIKLSLYDLLLQHVGEVLRTAVRQSDIVCRYGGEELVLVMPESPCAAADAALYAAKSSGRDRLVCSGAATVPLSPAATNPEPDLPGTELQEPVGARLRSPRRALDGPHRLLNRFDRFPSPGPEPVLYRDPRQVEYRHAALASRDHPW